MVAFAANAPRLVVAKMSTGGRVTAVVWDYDRNLTFSFQRHLELEELVAVALSADGKLGLSAAVDGVRFWEVESGKELRYWKGLPITRLAFVPDVGTILTGNSLGSLVLRDPKGEDEVGRFEGHTGAITDMVFSPDDRLLLTTSGDGTARLWDAKTRRELHRLEGHDGEVACGAVSSDGRRLVTGGADGTVRLWEIPTPDR
jgi:WD40 repeat protein